MVITWMTREFVISAIDSIPPSIITLIFGSLRSQTWSGSGERSSLITTAIPRVIAWFTEMNATFAHTKKRRTGKCMHSIISYTCWVKNLPNGITRYFLLSVRNYFQTINIWCLIVMMILLQRLCLNIKVSAIWSPQSKAWYEVCWCRLA